MLQSQFGHRNGDLAAVQTTKDEMVQLYEEWHSIFHRYDLPFVMAKVCKPEWPRSLVPQLRETSGLGSLCWVSSGLLNTRFALDTKLISHFTLTTHSASSLHSASGSDPFCCYF